MINIKNQQELLFSANNISFLVENNKILDNVSIKLRKGEILTIIGPNGSGKTSLVKIILGLIKPSSGKVLLNCKKSKIGYMPQKIQIDNILPIRVKDFLKLMNPNLQGDLKIIKISEDLGLSKFLRMPIAKISGGTMQRMLLANALIKDPEILVLDEPIQGVDITGQIEFYELIDKIRKSRKISILMISHDLHMVMKSTDYVVCLNQHICCHGQPDEVANNTAYHEAFASTSLEHFKIYHHNHDHYHD